MTASDERRLGVTRVGAYVVVLDEVDGSTDACAWFRRADAERLPLMELGRVGVRLAFVAEDGGA